LAQDAKKGFEEKISLVEEGRIPSKMATPHCAKSPEGEHFGKTDDGKSGKKRTTKSQAAVSP